MNEKAAEVDALVIGGGIAVFKRQSIWRTRAFKY